MARLVTVGKVNELVAQLLYFSRPLSANFFRQSSAPATLGGIHRRNRSGKKSKFDTAENTDFDRITNKITTGRNIETSPHWLPPYSTVSTGVAQLPDRNDVRRALYVGRPNTVSIMCDALAR